MSGINNNHYPMPMYDELKYNKKPSPYCKLMIQKFAGAPSVGDNSDVDWNKFSQTMSNDDLSLCELEFEWFKETGSKITVLTAKDTLIAKTSFVSYSSLPARDDCSSSNFSEDSLLVPCSNALQKITNEIPKSTQLSAAQSIDNSQLPTLLRLYPMDDFYESQSFASENSERGCLLDFEDLERAQHTSDPKKRKFPDEKKVSVLVRDRTRKVEKTFICPLFLLTSHMPYFKERLKNIPPDGEVHISLHCDVIVFEKILFYISKVILDDEKGFKIDPKYAIHLLVSADFLQMCSLVEKCLDYCYRHLSLIIQLNGPLGALNEQLISKLTCLFNHREVEAIEDPQGKIKEKLYKNLLEQLLKPEIKIPGQPGVEKLLKCCLCEQVFSTKLQELVPCKNKKAAVGSQGQLAFYHKRDLNWDCDQYLVDLYITLQSWRKVYWRVWGLVSCLHCTVCAKNFCCANYTKCSYHKDPIKLPETEPTSLQEFGIFPCCGHKSFQYDPIDPLHLSYGCCFRNHSVNANDRQSGTFQDMITYFDLICAPENSNESDLDLVRAGLQRIVPCFSDKILTRWIFDPSSRRSSDKKVSRIKYVKKSSKASQIISTASATVEITTENTDAFVPVLSTLTRRGRPLNTKHSWQPRASHWHNQDAVRDHDEAMMQRLMSELQKLQP